MEQEEFYHLLFIYLYTNRQHKSVYEKGYDKPTCMLVVELKYLLFVTNHNKQCIIISTCPSKYDRPQRIYTVINKQTNSISNIIIIIIIQHSVCLLLLCLLVYLLPPWLFSPKTFILLHVICQQINEINIQYETTSTCAFETSRKSYAMHTHAHTHAHNSINVINCALLYLCND